MGVRAFVLVELPITLLGASVGVWLFYVQHQFEDTLWAHDESWNQHEAALRGSSHYHLPGILRWFTANIGVHHVHHLCSRIPYYRLPRVLRDYPELAATGRLTLLESLKCVRLVLWDESQGRLVSFRDVREHRMHAALRAVTPDMSEPGEFEVEVYERVALESHSHAHWLLARNCPAPTARLGQL